MQVLNLVPAFIEKVLRNQNRADYETENPILFDHYYRYWSKRRPFPSEITGDCVTRQANLIKARLPVIEDNFRKNQLPLESITLVLFVGQGTTNGHAFTEHDRTIVWIPVETYDTELAIDVFVSHEIAHGLHYQYQSSRQFEFRNTGERYQIGRQLITEGLATYISQVIMNLDDPIALWADYLSPKDASEWMKKCAQIERTLAATILEQFYKTSVGKPYFVLTENDQVTPSRSGYYMGLNLIRRLVLSHGLSVGNLLAIERSKFEELAQLELAKMEDKAE